MRRWTCTLFLAGLALCATWPVQADDPPAAAAAPAGNWKMSFPVGGGNIEFLLQFAEAGGKWKGSFLGSSQQLRAKPTVEDVRVKDDRLRFTVKLGQLELTFDGKVPKEAGQKFKGSLSLNNQLLLVSLVPTKMKDYSDRYTAAREVLAQNAGDQEYFEALATVLRQAGAKKLREGEVRTLLAQATKAADQWGPRWQLQVALSSAQALADQEAFAPLAVAQANRAERLLDPTDDIDTQLRVLETLALALGRAKKTDELTEVQGRVRKVEAKDYAEYSKDHPPFKPDTFAGRKGKSDRVVLLELFTGSECPPCVAADLAFDGLAKTYKPSEVAILEYHLHIPRPDALTTKDGETRAETYKVEGTPALVANGKLDAEFQGGGAQLARERYREVRTVIDAQLEEKAKATLSATATRKGSEVAVTAKVGDLAKPGEKVKLRLVLAEERVRYRGGNGIRYHHAVVRGFVGGPKGFALTKKDNEQSATVNLDTLRADLNKQLEDFAQENGVQLPDRPMAFKNLHLVALVQDDATGEVLQALQVEVPAA